MFYHIEGYVTDVEQNLVAIDCNGIGFAINTTANSLAAIKKDQKCKFYIYNHVTENSFDLFGFTTKQEKHCFELLISVSGVGPKAAISILSSATPEMFAMAVMNEDISVLTNAPGIGKKIAQRVVLELKDKVAKENATITGEPFIPQSYSSNNAASEASQALSVLGYSASEISTVMKMIDVDGKTTEEIIKQALKHMNI